MRATVLVNTYNHPRYLELSLLSYFGQSFRDFEVIVADDGSGPETGELVESVRKRAPFPLRHVWQEDDGFRRTVILNKAVREASTDYLIFTDGDCLAHREFVASHVGFARRGAYLVSRTPRLSRKLSARVTGETVLANRAQRVGARMLLDYLFGETSKLEFGLYVGSDPLFRLVRRTKKNLLLWGGNFSCFRDDFIAVNGFNEEILGWGKEDAELDVRFRRYGLRPFSVTNRAVNFHLWHSKADRVQEAIRRNLEVKERSERSGEYRCSLGYDRH
jgi:glycosyltransferase involved in cell wall biosynthesis